MKKKDEDIIEKKFLRTQTCRNCGLIGHLYKDCVHPIISFGIICYKIENNIVKYLLIQRKDSLAFMEFVRGKYNLYDKIYIKQLINCMTNFEKELISKKKFDDIWNYAWSQNNIIIKHTNEYIESKRKFNIINDDNTLFNIISNSINNNYQQEWGFPKGRRKLKESDIDCAIREFCEETRMDKKEFKILENLNQFEEIFYGTNKILYKHIYFIAKSIINVDLYIDKSCLEQMREIRDLNWFTYNEVLHKIKSHNVERLEIFKKTNKLISLYENII